MENYQHILFPYAYNILGSVEDAKDAIQDVMSNYVSLPKKIVNTKNYLIKSVVNQAIQAKKKKIVLQDQVWLPEPIATEKADARIYLKY